MLKGKSMPFLTIKTGLSFNTILRLHSKNYGLKKYNVFQFKPNLKAVS